MRTEPDSPDGSLTIGLVNNMPDEALKATERQFGGVVRASAVGVDVQLRIFALSRTPRSPVTLEYISACYEPARTIMDRELDGLIITGAQPRTARLNDEAYWEELVDIIDWAKDNTVSTIFSCLAAHAGVLHIDGVERRPLREKRVGVFSFSIQHDRSFLGGRGAPRLVPHSRYNDLLQEDLELAGYDILSSSPSHGVDTFTKSLGSQFVFLQGHPEYDADSLAREYRRDFRRFMLGENQAAPALPKRYFSAESEQALQGLQRRALENPRRMPVDDALAQIDDLTPTRAEWRAAAITFFGNWIATIASLTGRGKMDVRPPIHINERFGKRPIGKA
jgi:homoserine O-succinyltransferase/O-acetyltransferase